MQINFRSRDVKQCHVARKKPAVWQVRVATFLADRGRNLPGHSSKAFISINNTL